MLNTPFKNLRISGCVDISGYPGKWIILFNALLVPQSELCPLPSSYWLVRKVNTFTIDGLHVSMSLELQKLSHCLSTPLYLVLVECLHEDRMISFVFLRKSMCLDEFFDSRSARSWSFGNNGCCSFVPGSDRCALEISIGMSMICLSTAGIQLWVGHKGTMRMASFTSLTSFFRILQIRLNGGKIYINRPFH